MMLVKKIALRSDQSPHSIAEALNHLPENLIIHANWEGEYPYIPSVAFKIAHDGTHLYIQYFVKEQEILAAVQNDNGAVWTDSCVEFFISFAHSPYYYNAEFTCIGKTLLGYRKHRKDVVYANQHTMSLIERYPSLGTRNFEKQKGDCQWDILIVIPINVFWEDQLTTFNGLKARANFYKCGDNLSEPHFVSWNPIQSDKPNFHLPAFFGELDFE